MVYIKSKLAGFSIYLLVYMSIIFLISIIVFFIKAYSIKIKNIGAFLILLFLLFLFILVINFLKHIRYLEIKDNELKYWSLFVPWGKTLYFDNYIGKIIETENGSGNNYKVVYLVDKKNRTTFKIMGVHYKNFDEINNAIPLKRIGFSPSVRQYFKLLFFERITIPDKKAKKQTKNENPGHNIAKIFAVISVIGVTLFVLGILVKILSKLM
jgi:energy-coupling factor transporter transmembrane protein EcfT